ncbi:ATP-dependent DNA ligase [Flavihumibacter petaseus]|uniref:DNA ligase (ATP) n=1 Tax=Flavihumibacter petaseus NBRC 106054 TaxID=1220578 RepID=A0A0E9MTZ2_9BACT|nr:ATP-dependent DNA ligase [Flavihumibacter petaseus]GAO41247.1 putative ATP-dependent DNA ligase [Flavihumibacter petaseus NBRC 106054]
MMRLFANLFVDLGNVTRTSEKTALLANYFQQAPPEDAIWVIALFSGRRPKRIVNSTLLGEWCRELTTLPLWLFEESYHTVGDLAETIALLLPDSGESHSSLPLHQYIDALRQLESSTPEEKKHYIQSAWSELNRTEKLVFNKLITGGFRIGVSQQLMVQALAEIIPLEPSQVAHQISGKWDPATTTFQQLFDPGAIKTDVSKPYPFFLAYAVEDDPSGLGEPDEWQAEWKWDGIRGQLVKREGKAFVWSRGEELMTEKFPEYSLMLEKLPDGTVLDGEILPAKDGRPLPFALLQTRIGRKNVTRKQLEAVPVAFFAYDLLEWQGRDIRELQLEERRALLEQVVTAVSSPQLLLSPVVSFDNWEALAGLRGQSREAFAEGFMIKRKRSSYQSGRRRGDWWKWKIDPLHIDAVMIYAQKGHGRRSNLYTDYTFAVRDGDKLVAFAKAYSGLTDREIAQVDAFVKQNALEKFGPVRTVKPELVFEIAFEGIAASGRHKSGVALRFPRISRWRQDKKPDEINTLEDLHELLQRYGKT